MKILLVDNVSVHFNQLKNALSEKHKVTPISIENVKLEYSKSFDAVVLSGGSKYEVIEDTEKFEEQFKIIKSGKPVLGVCLGFQIICHVFGERVERLGKEIDGVQKIQITKGDPLLDGLDKNFKAFEGHKWGVKKITGELVELAKSKDCIEAVKHPKFPVYGVQFHPEADKTLESSKVLENFVKIVGETRKPLLSF